MSYSKQLSLWIVMALCLATSPLYAGGRSETKIKVENDSTGPIAVGVDVGTATTLNEFIAAGGKFVNAGGSAGFKVLAGTHTVYVLDAVNPVFPALNTTVTVKKGKTKKLEYDPGDDDNDF